MGIAAILGVLFQANVIGPGPAPIEYDPTPDPPSVDDSLRIGSMTPSSPSRISIGSTGVSLDLNYDLGESAELNIIPLDQRRHPTCKLGWQARGAGDIWRGVIRPDTRMNVPPGSGGIELQFRSTQLCQISFLRLQLIRGSDAPAISDVPVDFTFEL